MNSVINTKYIYSFNENTSINADRFVNYQFHDNNCLDFLTIFKNFYNYF